MIEKLHSVDIKSSHSLTGSPQQSSEAEQLSTVGMQTY